MSKQQKHFQINIPRIQQVDFDGMVFDPILENPLDSEFEGLITMVGERRYLKAIAERFGIQFSHNLDELTDIECRKVIRGIMRHAEDYEGPEMKQ